MEAWRTLAGRMQWVLDTKSMSMRGWSMAAKLKSETHVERLRARSRKSWEERNEETPFEAWVVDALADAAQVNRTWLASGRGRPEDPPASFEVVRDDRYPNRAIAAKCARELGAASEEAIRNVQTHRLQNPGDMPAVWWLDRMRNEEENLHAGVLPGHPLGSDDDA